MANRLSFRRPRPASYYGDLPESVKEEQVGMLEKISNEKLKERLEKDVRIRDAAARILPQATNIYQRLDVAKTLLLYNARIVRCLQEADSLEHTRCKANSRQKQSDEPCLGSVCISEIRVPLLWRETGGNFAAFCLVRIGMEIRETRLVCDIGSAICDIEFDDVIILDNVHPDFSCTVELYGHQMVEAWYSGLGKNRLSSSFAEIKRHTSKRESSSLTQETPDTCFELIGRTTLTLSDVDNDAKSYDLEQPFPKSTIGLPVFGALCCRIAAKPDCVTRPAASGRLSVQEPGMITFSDYYCQLHAYQLNCWQHQSSQQSEASNAPPDRADPDLAIPMIKTTEVKQVDQEVPALTVVVYQESDYARKEYVLRCSTMDDCAQWMRNIERHIFDQVCWGHACDEDLDMPAPTSLVREGSIIRASVSLHTAS